MQARSGPPASEIGAGSRRPPTAPNGRRPRAVAHAADAGRAHTASSLRGAAAARHEPVGGRPDRRLGAQPARARWSRSRSSRSRVSGCGSPSIPATDDVTLDRGAGHVDGTAPPGSDGNVAIAGHRDGYFRVLKDVVLGDRLRLVTPAGVREYAIARDADRRPGAGLGTRADAAARAHADRLLPVLLRRPRAPALHRPRPDRRSRERLTPTGCLDTAAASTSIHAPQGRGGRDAAAHEALRRSRAAVPGRERAGGDAAARSLRGPAGPLAARAARGRDPRRPRSRSRRRRSRSRRAVAAPACRSA